MTRWAIGGAILVAGLAVIAGVSRPRTGPEVVVNAEVVPEPAPPVPPRDSGGSPPRLLTPVVDVTDIDALLDPPPIPAAAGPAPVLSAVGYDEPAPLPPPAGPVPPIPPAADDDDAP